MAWNWNLSDHWQFNLIGTYTLERETTPLPDDPTSAFDCAGVISPTCVSRGNGSQPSPDWRHVASATYDSSNWWAITARWRYIGAVDYEGATDLIVDDNTDAHNYVDLNAVFRFMDTHDVVVGVNNVFDKEPPMIGGTIASNGNTMVGFYDTLGRFFFADDEAGLASVYVRIDEMSPRKIETISFRPRQPLAVVPLAIAALMGLLGAIGLHLRSLRRASA